MLVKDNGGSCTVYFEGEINLNSINKFKEDIHTMDVEIEKDIILNFNQVSYINSLGLGAIIDLYKKSKVKKRGLTIVCNSPMVREVFEVVKFNKLIPIFNTDEEALG
ncbi:MAG: STAS domain-containing protein [Clostridia bacterium]|nr:STAS domain-containing protein [Clostridia bacterium]